MASSGKGETRLWVDRGNDAGDEIEFDEKRIADEKFGRTMKKQSDGRYDEPPPKQPTRVFSSLVPGAVTESTAGGGDKFVNFSGVEDTHGDASSDDDDDEDSKTIWEWVTHQTQSLAVWLISRFDLLLGVGASVAALWLWWELAPNERADGKSHAWRGALFGACVFLGRFLARSMVSFVIFLLNRYDQALGSNDDNETTEQHKQKEKDTYTGKVDSMNRRPVNAVLYYVNVMRGDIKNVLLVVGVAVAWTTLMRPSRDEIGAEAYANISRALGCAIVVVVFRALRNYLTHALASRLHSSTLWEQLHATTRHESILRRLAGPPIRPRPRSKFKAKTRWTLVKKKVDDLGSPSAGRKDGNDKGGQGGGRHGRKRSDELQAAIADAFGNANVNVVDSVKTKALNLNPKPATASLDPGGSMRKTLDSGVHDVVAQASTGKQSDAKETEKSASSATGTEHQSEHASENASAWLPSVIESIEEANALDYQAWHQLETQSVGTANGEPQVSPADAWETATELRQTAALEAPLDAPISASAAAGVLGSSHEPVTSASVSLRVIDAAARHVLRGTFALPFRVLTVVPRKLSGGGGASGQTSGSSALQKNLLTSASGQHSDHHLKATTKRAFVSSPEDADAAATMMFAHLRRPGQPFVTPDAVGDFIEPDRVEEAFLLIGGADSGVAALAETNIATAMRKIYEQREACSKTLANTAGLVRNVGRLLSTLLGIIAVFVSLGIFRVDVANLWLVFSSALLAFAFVFGQTASQMFRALIMIFITNPFGVGDWVRFGDDPVAVKIHELGLNFVVVATFWGELIFLPVSTCLDAHIYNLSRSPPLWMNAAFDLDVGSIAAADIEKLQNSLSAHCDSDSANYAKGSVDVICREVRDPLKIRISCFYQLAFNASEFSRKLAANSRFLLALQQSMMEIGLSYCGTDGQIFTCEETGTGKTLQGMKKDSGKATPIAPSPTTSRRVSKGDVARDIAKEFRKGVQKAEAAGREGTPERTFSDAGQGGGVRGGGTQAPTPASGAASAPAIDSERQLEASRLGGGGDAARFPPNEGNRDGGGFVPGLGYVIPDLYPGLRFRGSHRIPGRVRHYTGNLRDMSDVVRFDAREGQFDE